MLPNSRRQAAAIAALKRARALAVFIALGFTFGMTQAAAVNPDQPIQLDGMELFFGLIPAEILRGHPSDHEERRLRQLFRNVQSGPVRNRRQCAATWRAQNGNSALSILASTEMSAGGRS